MNAERFEEGLPPRIQGALDELRNTIAERYPTASFAISRDEEEPENVHLMTTVALDDPDEVLDPRDRPAHRAPGG